MQFVILVMPVVLWDSVILPGGLLLEAGEKRGRSSYGECEKVGDEREKDT